MKFTEDDLQRIEANEKAYWEETHKRRVKVWMSNWFFVPGRRRPLEFRWHHGYCSHFTAWQIRFVVFGYHTYVVFRGRWVTKGAKKALQKYLDERMEAK